jgi:hypothetical protein
VENTVDGFDVLEIEVERGGAESLTGLGEQFFLCNPG